MTSRRMTVLSASLAFWALGCGVEVGTDGVASKVGGGGSPKPAPAKVEWVEFAKPGAGFTVLLPGKPDEGITKEPTGDGKDLEHHSFALVSKPNAYIVDYLDMDFDLPDEGKAKFYDAMRDGNIESRQAKLVEEKEITVDGVVGRNRVDEQATKMGPFVMMTRSFMAGRRYYTVMASAPKAVLDADGAAKFLDSFHLVKAAEEPAKDKDAK